VLAEALPSGSVAYVDREWLATSSADVPALVAFPDGTLAWRGRRPVPTPSAVDSETAAALALLAVAEIAVAATEGVSPDQIEVTGNGVIALQVRALLAHSSSADYRSHGIEQAAAIIDTTGDPEVIVDATRRTANLGTVVLAGEALGRTAEMNLYPDVHVRGLSLVGVPAPLHDANALFSETRADDPLVASCCAALVGATAGTPLLPGAAWYRVVG
jgi:threonine dehydrogenase-like Zn-dependent dehydrogenase